MQEHFEHLGEEGDGRELIGVCVILRGLGLDELVSKLAECRRTVASAGSGHNHCKVYGGISNTSHYGRYV